MSPLWVPLIGLLVFVFQYTFFGFIGWIANGRHWWLAPLVYVVTLLGSLYLLGAAISPGAPPDTNAARVLLPISMGLWILVGLLARKPRRPRP